MRHLLIWQRGLAALLLLLSCASLPTAAVRASDSTSANYRPNEVLVKLNPSANLRAIAASHRLKIPQSSVDQLDQQPIYRFEIADGKTPPDKAAELMSDRSVIYAEPDYVGELPQARQRSSWVVGDDIGGYAAQWAPAALRLPEAHMVTQGVGVTIAILDTGADLGHPTLAGRLIPGYDFVDDDVDPSEVGIYGSDMAYGHGTHVAGLVALTAPDAKIMPLRTLGPDGIGTIWAQVQALRFAINRGVDVINLSYSFRKRSRVLEEVLAQVTCTTTIDDECRTKLRPGAIVAAASGNSGDNDREYPAATFIPGVLAVAASTEANTLAVFSTYGPWVQLAAPGDHVLSSVPGGYAVWSGTSMAAPLAAGTAALVRAASPSLRPADIVTRLITTGASLSGPVRRRVDAAAALRLPAGTSADRDR
ncbi:MAG TPA: S8 family serine peptidase [Roseiflexaceae bacterium]|nr:S8 family serine peptidase [Roseiflexaceae bacterium]